ncbi:MAG: gliding motility-associated C-terminal domain-containing protein [Saonia sp.]
MKNQLYIGFLLLVCTLQAQTALYNSGNIRIHEEGQIGFHTDLINDAAFDENLGLAGFYGNGLIRVSGAFAPTFYDTEIANDAGLALDTGINTENNTNFVTANVFTPRDEPDVYFNFLENAFYVGASDASKIDGYATVTDQQSFNFPIGDSQQLRPLILNSSAANPQATCAYFFENPENPSTFSTIFDTRRKVRGIGTISTTEFWRLEGSIPATISISWNERSNMAAIADDVNTITVVGWEIATGRWLILGSEALAGDLNNGFVSSESFIPNDYAIITFGSLTLPEEILTLDNYLVSPNGDGANDMLVIPEMELSPNNSIKIFDRFGLKVFEMANYTNEFNGISNIDNFVINRNIGLPEGVYFYLVSLDDLNLNFQGFLYLDR